MRFARRSTSVFALVTSLIVVASVANAGALVPDPVKTGNHYQFRGTGNADYFAWSRDGAGSLDVRVDPVVGSTFTVDGTATGVADSVDQTGSLLSWTRIKNGVSHVRLYDMATQANVPLPDGINTNKFVWDSGIFGNTFTFMRGSAAGDSLFLVTDLSTGDKTKIITFDPHVTLYGPPRLYGNWIVWSTISQSGWKAYRYDIANDLTQKVPSHLQKWHYAPSVDLAGNVYFARSGHSCGASVRLMKWDGNPGDDPVVLYSFDPGIDVVYSSLFDDGLGTVTVYVDFLDCGTFDSDIYSFSNP